ncbi:ATP-binding protein [Corynebacterium sp. 13CS0277]|uniref:ATP-binding protein n=1 Tax=Corynebacterium sp. 13CS0277 TaxID=2071994 RepID=UPI001E4160A5|nr:DUF4143 domain-containing protein [Corynebacterium sp. 13CS0277]
MTGAAAVALDGVKGVGKTETALRRATHTWFLDDPQDRSLAKADQDFALVPDGTLLIDEWQNMPVVWDQVRRAVDRGATPGRFLLTGSATPPRDADAHSGAGRILSLRMRPMALFERGHVEPTVSLEALCDGGGAAEISGRTTWTVADYVTAICESGFPGILRVPDEEIREEFLRSYIYRVIDRDLPHNGYRARHPEVLRRWLAAYAAASSLTTSYSRILDATTGGDGEQPSKQTTQVYREHLTALWLLDPVPGFVARSHEFGRLTVAPKHQLADPALAAILLDKNAATLAQAKNAGLLGQLFESLTTLSVRVAADAIRARTSHLRESKGAHEIDLIVEDRRGRVVAIEVKLASYVEDKDVRHLLWLKSIMGEELADMVVVTTGQVAYRRPDGVAVVPLALLGV